MPRGPNGQRRPADTVKAAHKVFQIAIGEDSDQKPTGKRRSELAGSKARKEAITDERRKEITKKAANSRWRQHG
jgi:hypothetical protein